MYLNWRKIFFVTHWQICVSSTGNWYLKDVTFDIHHNWKWEKSKQQIITCSRLAQRQSLACPLQQVFFNYASLAENPGFCLYNVERKSWLKVMYLDIFCKELCQGCARLQNCIFLFVGARDCGWLQECKLDHFQELQKDQWDVTGQDWRQKSLWQPGIWRGTGNTLVNQLGYFISTTLF